MYAPILGITGQSIDGIVSNVLGGRFLKCGDCTIATKKHKCLLCFFVAKDLLEIGQCVDQVGLAFGDDADFLSETLIRLQEARDAVFRG